jgi:ATP-binding cassette subfamily B protein
MIWFGSGKTSAGALQLGVLVAFIQYIRRCFVPIRDLSQKYTVLQSALASSERIFSLLDEPVTLDEISNARAIQKIHHGIALNHVWFSYGTPPTEESWILKDVSLAIGVQEHVALVGETGSGKTTMGKLLNRFYDVQQGVVLVDGVDIKTVCLADLRRLFAVVLQDVYLFSGTVIQNLTLGGRISEESVREAAKNIGVEEWIVSLPQGYATLLHEFGSNLSSGERQLLALVRALAVDPAVIIMDEATSNVDSETEAMLQRGLDVVMHGRAALVIAHRLSTVQKMDRIVVLQRGRIQDEGSHAVLMLRDGYYRKLVEAQFRDDGISNSGM